MIDYAFESLQEDDVRGLNGIKPDSWSSIEEIHGHYLRTPNCRCIKAVRDRRIIGIGTGISFEGTGWLAHIIVASEHQNRGIGSSIVRNRMEDLLERQGCKAVTFSGDPMTKKGLPLIALAAAFCALSCSLVVSAKESKPPAVTVWEPLPEVPKLPIGMNMCTLNYWTPALVFTDVMTTASDMLTSYYPNPETPWDTPWNTEQIGFIERDANGYPLGLPQTTPDGRASFVRFLVNNYYRGTFRIYFEGTGTLGGGAYLQNGAYYIDLDGTGGHRFIEILTSDPADHIRDMHILPPGTAPDSGYPVFLEDFVEGLRPFRALRFMDWIITNNSTQTEWEDRVTKEYYTQGGSRGISLDYAVDLCNLLDADAWVCVPHLASDDYMRKLAELWDTGLESGRTIYLEYSNEVWNWMFAQSHYVVNNAPDAADSYVSADLAALGNPGEGHPEKDAYMMARLFRIWNERFGTAKGRLVRVATGQHAWMDNSRRILEYLFNTAGVSCDVLSVGGYFSFNETDHNAWMANPTIATSDAICDAAYDRLYEESAVWTRESAKFARQYGVDFMVYEGGQHMQPFNQGEWPYNENLFAAQIHPKMRQLYLRNFAVHVEPEVDCKLFMAFLYVGERSSRWGSWGHLESLDQVGTDYASTAPKYQALLDCMADR